MTALTAEAPPRLPELHPLSFTLPPELEAPAPAEVRGLTRDAVRMMVASKHDGSIVHSHFSELPRFLDEGDLVVINTSGTLAAELDGTGPDGVAVQVHLSTKLPAGLWTVEVRRQGEVSLGASAGDRIELAGGGRVILLAPYSPGPGGQGVRLWISSVETPEPLQRHLARHGRPIRYGYVRDTYPISAYQNVYATEPGSAEMPSAGRPFTARDPDAPGRQGCRGGACAAPHRGRFPGGQRAALRRVLPRLARHGAPGQRHAPIGWARRGGRDHRRPQRSSPSSTIMGTCTRARAGPRQSSPPNTRFVRSTASSPDGTSRRRHISPCSRPSPGGRS